ncbi:MAG: hypothetical protein QOE55_1780 [Acidobacteriaceae bacterium]|jgi:hypothetical protein|nr:hypothetical protein [Acidobacteriaceae bacterium]
MQLVQGERVNETADCRDTVGWNTCAARVLPNAVFIRRQVNAIDFVLGDVTVEPLNLRPHSIQSLQRAQGHLPDLYI